MTNVPRRAAKGANSPGLNAATPQARVRIPASNTGVQAAYSFVDLGDSVRVAVSVCPEKGGTVAKQTLEVIDCLRGALAVDPRPLRVTSQTVFLREPEDQPACERLLRNYFKSDWPITSWVLQPPCSGAALALEAWAIGGVDIRMERHGPQVLSLSYDSVRWVYCGGIRVPGGPCGVYEQTRAGIQQVRDCLKQAGSDFCHVVRTWFYLGDITELENDTQRYKELNRARTDMYREIPFHGSWTGGKVESGVYPASTGIGMQGTDLVLSCVALETARTDVFLLPLENPRQTPAYAYHPRYSPKSPKFSRAMALILGDYVTTWVSGTASIVDSESRHLGSAEAQTTQTIDNIENLVAADNFRLHGVAGTGATLKDFAKIRVYIKRMEDLEKVKAVCENRFGKIPAIYAVADVCRPELLVEIEGIAFSNYSGPPVARAGLSRFTPGASEDV